jgi:hypothetical protein
MMYELEARELRRTVHHECGHKAMANHFGISGTVEIWKNESGKEDECAWRGRFVHEPISVSNTPLRQIALIGVAGMVAEQMWIVDEEGEEDLKEYPAWYIEEQLEFSITFGEASESDVSMINVVGGLTEELVEEAVSILRNVRESMKAEAEQHIAAHS